MVEAGSSNGRMVGRNLRGKEEEEASCCAVVGLDASVVLVLAWLVGTTSSRSDVVGSNRSWVVGSNRVVGSKRVVGSRRCWVVGAGESSLRSVVVEVDRVGSTRVEKPEKSRLEEVVAVTLHITYMKALLESMLKDYSIIP